MHQQEWNNWLQQNRQQYSGYLKGEQMETVQEVRYFHVHRSADPNWKVGASFYHYNPQQCLVEATDCLNHYLRLAREFVFEDVRRDSFSMLPSRYRCTWLIPKKPDCVQYWLQALEAGKGKIFELEVTGKIHTASQRYLHLGTYSLNTWRQLAFKYWSGIREVETKEDEVLFEGFVKVTRELTAEEAIAC